MPKLYGCGALRVEHNATISFWGQRVNPVTAISPNLANPLPLKSISYHLRRGCCPIQEIPGGQPSSKFPCRHFGHSVSGSLLTSLNELAPHLLHFIGSRFGSIRLTSAQLKQRNSDSLPPYNSNARLCSSRGKTRPGSRLNFRWLSYRASSPPLRSRTTDCGPTRGAPNCDLKIKSKETFLLFDRQLFLDHPMLVLQLHFNGRSTNTGRHGPGNLFKQRNLVLVVPNSVLYDK